MKECVNCGRSLSEIARFCPTCGTPVVVQAPDASVDAEGGTADTRAPVLAASESATATAAPDTIVETRSAPAGEPSPAPIALSPEHPVAQHLAPAPSEPVAAAPGQRACPSCGAVVPNEDLFCGDCGAPISSPAAAAAPIVRAPVFAAAPGPGAQAHLAPAGPSGFGGIEDYLSFRALWVTAHAVALFWIAEGVNVIYWILDWVVSNRWSGAQGFLGSVAGLVLFALLIRIVVEAAVAASRAGSEDSPRS